MCCSPQTLEHSPLLYSSLREAHTPRTQSSAPRWLRNTVNSSRAQRRPQCSSFGGASRVCVPQEQVMAAAVRTPQAQSLSVCLQLMAAAPGPASQAALGHFPAARFALQSMWECGWSANVLLSCFCQTLVLAPVSAAVGAPGCNTDTHRPTHIHTVQCY